MEFLTFFFGRLHPVLVHFPVGILLLAFVFEFLGTREKFKNLKDAVQFTLLVGAGSAVFSAVTGYLLSLEGGYPDELLTFHQYLGIATACLSVLLFFVRERIFKTNKILQDRVRVFLMFVLVVLLSITGHIGGSITHGEEYLLEAFALESTIDGNMYPVFKPIANSDQAILYHDIIQPILEVKCYSCHSSKKQKGQLRLDAIELITRGGKNGVVLKTDTPDSSSLYHRLILPLEDEEHMPPKEKPQLSSAEIDLIHLWVNEGASFDRKVAQYTDPTKIKVFFTAIQAASTPPKTWIPKEDISPADVKLVQKLKAAGALIMPVGQESNYLMINFVNVKDFNDSVAASLIPLQKHIVWLNLSNIKVSPAHLKIITQLHNLRYLYLSNSGVSDLTTPELAKLSNLQFLNLVGTEVGEAGLKSLLPIKSLQELFVYQTRLSAKGFQELKAERPDLKIDTGGYTLPFLATDTIIYKRK